MSINPEDEPKRVRWLGGIAAVLLAPLVVIWWPGCRQYSPVTSREALGLMQLLYTACNTKDPARLAKVETGIGKLTREGKMTPDERDGFDRIIAMAKANDWSRAEAAAFKFAQDQVGVGHPDPKDVHDGKKPASKGKK